MSQTKKLIVIVGPTAIGKTNLSIELAKYLNTYVLSADSRQFYKEMSIGTAKPSIEEMKGVPHYFIDSLSIHEDYTAGKYEQDFLKITEQLFKEKDTLIAVGGSGLFIKAICEGFDDIPSDISIRNKLMKRLESEGIEILQNELKEADPSFFKNADIQNPHRVIRALEVFNISGTPISSYQSKSKKERPFEIIKVGLEMKRELLYNRINRRVDLMVKEGLLNEVENLIPFKDLSSLQTVGYQEFLPYFNNQISLDDAIELVKRNTRRFAKRQMTWFKKDKEIQWFNAESNPKETYSLIKNHISNG